MTPEQIEQGRAMRAAGASYAAIGRELSIPATTIARHLKQTDDPYQCGPSAVAELDPGDVAAEIRVMRSELKKARDAGAPAVVLGQLAKVINDLSKNYVASAVRSGRMLHLDRCKEYILAIGSLFIDEFQHCCPDAQERIDRIVASVASPLNDKRQTHELIGRER
jgi:hypothetical protein